MSLSDLQTSVVKKLKDSDVDQEITATIESQIENSQCCKLFDGLETTYLQTKYFKENYNLLVGGFWIDSFYGFIVTNIAGTSYDSSWY